MVEHFRNRPIGSQISKENPAFALMEAGTATKLLPSLSRRSSSLNIISLLGSGLLLLLPISMTFLYRPVALKEVEREFALSL